MDIYEIRRLNLIVLIKEARTAKNLGKLCDVNAAYITQIKNRQVVKETGKERTMGREIASRLEAGMGKSDNWIDEQHPELWGTEVRESAAKPYLDERLQRFNEAWEFMDESLKDAMVGVADSAIKERKNS